MIFNRLITIFNINKYSKYLLYLAFIIYTYIINVNTQFFPATVLCIKKCILNIFLEKRKSENKECQLSRRLGQRKVSC